MINKKEINKENKRLYAKEYRLKNRKKLNEKAKIYYYENKEEISKKSKIYRDKPENKEKAKISGRKHYIKNRVSQPKFQSKEERKLNRTKSANKYYTKNKEKIKLILANSILFLKDDYIKNILSARYNIKYSDIPEDLIELQKAITTVNRQKIGDIK